MTFAWKTKTTPMRALNRRKLADIVGREKDGREMKSEGSVPLKSSLLEDGSSRGIICWRTLGGIFISLHSVLQWSEKLLFE